eukprot:s2600_g1.t1
MLSRSLPAQLSASYLQSFLSVQHAVSLPPSEALAKLLPQFTLRPTCCIAPSHAVSLPPGGALRKLFPPFPVRPACCIAPSQRSSPQAICTVSWPSSMLSRSLLAKLSASYLHGFLCCIAFCRRRFPQPICTVSSPSSMLPRALPVKLSASYLHGFLSVQHAVSLSPSEPLPKLFARFPVRPACCLALSRRSFPQAICTVSPPSSMLFRSGPAKLSASYLHGFRFPIRPACCLVPSQRSSPQAICTVSYIAPPSVALRKLFAWFPIRLACCHAPSQRSSPKAICMVSYPSSMLSRSLPAKLFASYFHGFHWVQHAVSLPPGEAFRKHLQGFLSVQHAVSLPPSEALRKLLAPYPSSIMFRSFPAKLSASYLHGFLSVQHAVSLPASEALRKLFALFPVRQAVSLLPGEALRKLFARCMLFRSLPAKLSPSYLHGFLSVQHAVSLLPMLYRPVPAKLSASYLHRFISCCIAPSQRRSPQAICTVSWPSSMLYRSSQRSSPQAICTVSSPSRMLYRSLPAKLYASYLHRFPSVQHAVSLLPSEGLRKLFPRLRLCPACCIAPSQRSSPQAICTVSHPSSMLSRSFPAKVSASYFHGFVSAQHAVSLAPSETLRKLFARFPVRPACCLAPSQRSSLQAICRVSYPSSMLSRSFSAKLSASYLHGFLSVQHAVSLLPSEALRKLFARFPVRPACCIAFCRRRFAQPICTVSYPSSMLSGSLPAKLSASYFHGFVSVQHAVSLPPGEAFPKLFARFPVRPAKLSASYLHGFLSASMLSRSLPAKLSASYWHHFLSVQHAVSLPPSEAFHQLLSTVSFIRPACCIAPSRRSSRQAISTVSCLQHAVSPPLSETFCKRFPRLRLCPACCLAPSQGSFPQAICTVSSSSSMLHRSFPAKLSVSYLHGFLSVQHAVSFLPAKLSASYLHGFLSVQDAVSLPRSEALCKLFARFPLRPACCLAPSQRRSPQAIATASSPPRMLYRSLPAKLSASYSHGFPSVQHAVSVLPSEGLRKLFPRLCLRPACCIAPSQRSFSKAICTVSSLPPSKGLRKLFARFPVRPACCIASSRRSSPQAICTFSYPSRMLYRSLPAKLSPSYLHGFLSCCIPPCQRRSPQAICTVSPPSSMLYPFLPAKLSASYLHGFLSCCMAPSRQTFPQAICTVSSPAVLLPPSEGLRKLFARFPLRMHFSLADFREVHKHLADLGGPPYIDEREFHRCIKEGSELSLRSGPSWPGKLSALSPDGRLASGPVALLYIGSSQASEQTQDMAGVLQEFQSLDPDTLLVHFVKDNCDEISGKIMPQVLAKLALDQYEGSDFLLFSKDYTTYIRKLATVNDMKQFLQSAQEDLAKIQMFKHHCRSGPRTKDDMEPFLPNCWRVTVENFEEVVLNPECDVFIQEFANWCESDEARCIERARQIQGQEGFLQNMSPQYGEAWIDVLRGPQTGDGATRYFEGLPTTEKGRLADKWQKAMVAAQIFEDAGETDCEVKATELIEVKFQHQLHREMEENKLGATMEEALEKGQELLSQLRQKKDCVRHPGRFASPDCLRQVHFAVQEFCIYKIDTSEWEFEASFALLMEWQLRQEDLKDLKKSWCPPPISIRNAVHGDLALSEEKPKLFLKDKGKQYWYRKTVRVNCKCREVFELEHFPFDVQPLQVIVNWGPAKDTWKLLPPVDASCHCVQYSPLQDVPEWEFKPPISELYYQNHGKLVEIEHVDDPVKERDDIRPALIIKATAKRISRPFLFQVAYIYSIIGVMGNCVFFLHPDQEGERMNLIVTVFLCAVTFQNVVDSGLPKLSYSTLFQKFMLIMNMLVLLPLGEICLSKWHDHEDAWSDFFFVYYNVGAWLFIHLYFLVRFLFCIGPAENRKKIEVTPRKNLLSMSGRQGIQPERLKIKEEIRYKRKKDFGCEGAYLEDTLRSYHLHQIRVQTEEGDEKKLSLAENQCLVKEGDPPSPRPCFGGCWPCRSSQHVKEPKPPSDSHHCCDQSYIKDSNALLLFSTIDADNSGQISKDEMAQFMRMYGDQMGEGFSSMPFDQIDMNGDGEVDFHELSQMFHKLPQKDREVLVKASLARSGDGNETLAVRNFGTHTMCRNANSEHYGCDKKGYEDILNDGEQAHSDLAGYLKWVAEKAVDASLLLLQEFPADQRATQFRKLLFAFHPDKNLEKNEVATAIFQHLQQWKPSVGKKALPDD